MANTVTIGELQGMQRDGQSTEPITDALDIETDDEIEAQVSALGEAVEVDAGPQHSALVPNDSAFAGQLYRDAPELANIADRLIGEHGFLGSLAAADIRYFWKRKTGVAKGRRKIGFLKRASDLLGHYSGADFIVWLAADTAREAGFTDAQVEAAVFHQLLHVGEDDNGNWIKVGHDFEGFGQEVRVYGPWTEDLKVGRNAFNVATQLGLDLDGDDDDEADEDLSD